MNERKVGCGELGEKGILIYHGHTAKQTDKNNA